MHKIAIKWVLGLVIATFVAGPAAVDAGQASAKTDAAAVSAAKKGPKAVFPEKKFEFEPVTEGVKVTHDFIIENQGNAPLVIKNIRPD